MFMRRRLSLDEMTMEAHSLSRLAIRWPRPPASRITALRDHGARAVPRSGIRRHRRLLLVLVVVADQGLHASLGQRPFALIAPEAFLTVQVELDEAPRAVEDAGMLLLYLH